MLVQIRKPSAAFATPFRFRSVGDKVVVTSHFGDHVLLDGPEFERFSRGDVAPDSPLYGRLRAANLVRSEFDKNRAADALRARKGFVHYGPNLHIFVVTLRCNETCIYCHASRAPLSATETDMSRVTAERSVDLALSTTNPNVTIEFQGGEPLVNLPVVKHIVEYAVAKNKDIGKQLEFSMVSNLSLMTEEILAWLIENRIQVCTSIDGPAQLHDKQRRLPTGSAFGHGAQWIRRINEAFIAEGLNPEVYHVEALLTTTRGTLPLWKEVVDTYVDLGCRALFLRPLDPFGFSARVGDRIAYPIDEYMTFYRQAVDYMLELNKQGVQILERFASIFLTKILGGIDPNYLDIRSPCGAGIGQVAYSYDGKLYTCDEGRMLAEDGDESFVIGEVGKTSYREMVGHETVRAMAIASNLDAQPDCVNCAYNPYCGVCPVHNHKTQGSLFGRMRDSHLCAVHKGIQDYLFEKLGQGDADTLAAFDKWITVRDRSHYLQSC